MKTMRLATALLLLLPALVVRTRVCAAQTAVDHTLSSTPHPYALRLADLAYKGTSTGDVAEADVEAVGTSLQYTGVVLNGDGVNPNLAFPFIKVQQQNGSGTFDNIATYLGNNGSSGAFGIGFTSVSTPFHRAHLRATRNGSTVTIQLTHVDGGALADQTYISTGAPAPVGNSIGVHGYEAHTATLDNFGDGATVLDNFSYVGPLSSRGNWADVAPGMTADGSKASGGFLALSFWTGVIRSCQQDVSPQFTAPTCGSIQTVQAGTSLVIAVSAFDPDGADSLALNADIPGSATFTSTGGNPATGTLRWTPSPADSGCHRIEFTAFDGCIADTCRITLCVITNRPPDCSGAVASEAMLWPPDHSFHRIAIAGVTDPDGDPVTIRVTGITQDEPVNGRGDGNTCPDGLIDAGSAAVRAERTGTPAMPGNGRVYAINFIADDGRGGTCPGTVNVCVPHDQGTHSSCIDDGQRYNSLNCGRDVVRAQAESFSLAVSRITPEQATFEFSLAADTHVRLALYDALGRRVATVVNADFTAGSYQQQWSLSGLSNGMYFARMQAGDVTLTKTLLHIH